MTLDRNGETSAQPRSIFISHGAGPFPLLGDPVHQPLIDFLESHRDLIPPQCKGIILVSAHWETEHPHITTSDNPGIFYDYEDQRSSLPKEAFEFEFPRPGSSVLATHIANTLETNGFNPVLDYDRGWDHAVLVPMAFLRPEWDLPIIQMSILKGSNEERSTKKNLHLGHTLRSVLQDQQLVLIGSGSSSHDFELIRRAYMSGAQPVESQASVFEDVLVYIAALPCSERENELVKWRSWQGNEASHLPEHSDHLMPFMVAAGAGSDCEKCERVGVWDLVGAAQSMYVWN